MEKVFAITTALASFAFLPLCAPSTLLWTIPAFGISLVSNQKEMLSFSHHYFDVPLTVMFVGFVFGLKSVRDNTGLTRFLPAQRQSAIALAFGCALLFQHTRLPTYWIRKSLPNSHERALVTEVERLQMAVPENAAIWVPDSLGPYLARHYGLRSILDTSPELLGGPNEVWIVLASGINHWPLNDEQVNELEQWVKQRVEQGQLIKQSEFVHLQVYATNRTDSR